MRQLSYKYKSKETFLSYVYDNNLEFIDKQIFIQLFSSKGREATQKALKEIFTALPNVTLIGCSSAGEIIDLNSLEEEIVLSISIFEKSTIKAIYTDEKESYELGVKVARELIKDDTKCVISFINGLQHISETYIKGFQDNNANKTIITGGVAADLLKFEDTFIIFNDKIYTKGAVAVALGGENLRVHSDYNLGRKAIGPTFTITKAINNRIYEIENKPTLDFYEEMLGEDVIQNMPASAVEFALLKEENGINFARMLIKTFDDGSALYTGVFHEGDKVRFSFSNLAHIGKHSGIKRQKEQNWNFQAAFIYTCVSKKEFLSFELHKALPNITQLNTIGFFTYGEFYSQENKAMLFNMATSLLFLDEKTTNHAISIKKEINIPKTKKATGSAILHLIDYVSANFQSQQKEFEETKFKLDAILNAINSVLIISRTDVHGIITYANEGFEKISGYSKEELLGKSHNIVRDPQIKKKIFKEMWGTIKKGNIWYGILSNRAKDGSIYYVKTHIFPIFDQEHKKIVEYMAVREDITELENTLKKVKQAKVAQAMFLANMAHEIRTPMNGIFGFTQLLEKSNLSEEQRKYVNIISNSTKTLVQLLNDILDSSKIENNKLELEKIKIDLHEELLMVHELLQSLAQKKSLLYGSKFDVNMAKCIESDPTRLKQVITNLLSNAIKFTPVNGKVILETNVLNEDDTFQTIRFSVKDSGIGISEDKLKTIFQPFTQAESATTRKFGGTGLGLNISANLVKAFGGELQVKSKLNKGTTFFFDIKLKKCDTNNLPHKLLDDKSNPIFTEDINVLVAEDYEINQKLLEAIFIKYPNISYEFANDGEEVINKAVTSSYDIIFMDVKMPKINGIEATKEIRKRLKETPIIALTANMLEEERIKLFDAGVNDYLTKPIELREFQRVLQTYAIKKETLIESEDFNFEKLLKTIEANLGLDRETVLPLFKAFIINLKESLKTLEEALKNKDNEQVVNTTHKLRGTSASFSLDAIASILKTIEQEAKNEQISTYKEKLQAIKDAINLLEEHLH